MIQYIKNPAVTDWGTIIQRPTMDAFKLEKKVQKILQKVAQKGDKALYKYTKKLDGVVLTSLAVTEAEIELALTQLAAPLKEAIQQAKQNIETFHIAQKEDVKMVETVPGVMCWRESKGIEKVGLYIPGGSAPLFSTVLMLAIPAAIAGCNEIILCTPPAKDGTINPAILYAAHLCGVTKIFKVGGAQAIGAMAYGTASIPNVYKIFGPGNQYVTTAKQLIQKKGVAIDMPAGPSEVLVIADDTAVPAYVASDLLSQAEHGPDSQVILLTTSEKFVEQVQLCIKAQLPLLPRNEVATKALANSRIVLLSSLDDAVALSNQYAPEHLIVACTNTHFWAKKITTAGSVFLGNYTPESAGDYASGTNHTLPTNGYASAYSGVSLDSFLKKITFQQLTIDGLTHIANTVMTMAAAEGLEAHKQAVAIRLKK
ncbi:MAG: bifunctional histidinal dehydrogenase/histidinol dehydrogenase [Bacteroidota bacterium]